MKVELNPAVHIDLLEIMERYIDEAGTELAVRFYAEFRLCADQIRKRPESFPTYNSSYRRANLKTFPYNILFRRVDGNTVRILVVRHDHRHPSFGLDRG